MEIRKELPLFLICWIKVKKLIWEGICKILAIKDLIFLEVMARILIVSSNRNNHRIKLFGMDKHPIWPEPLAVSLWLIINKRSSNKPNLIDFLYLIITQTYIYPIKKIYISDKKHIIKERKYKWLTKVKE